MKHNWRQLVVDVTHYLLGLYLAMIDCRPGCIAIWREIKAEAEIEIARVLEELFWKEGQ